MTVLEPRTSDDSAGQGAAPRAAAPVRPATPTGLRSLDPHAMTLWRLTIAAQGLGLVALAVVAEIGLDLPFRRGILAAPVAALALATLILLPIRMYQAWKFALREDHFHLRRGVLFHTSSIIPYARIQHVDTRHGPLDRWLGLASLVIFTAGTRVAIVTVPALPADDAEELRDALAALSGSGDAV